MPSISLTNSANITELELTTISTQKLSGSIDITNFTNIINLSANDNDIQDFTFSAINDANLERCWLNYNKLTGSVNTYIPLNIREIGFDKNRLTSISSLSSHTNLIDFRCSENPMTGSLPDISSNTALVIFKMYSDGLTGTIPDITANTNLKDFQVNKNNLTGSLPDISNNTALEIFKYGGNSGLTGSIPSLSTNTELTVYEGFFTNVGGSIPSLSANIKLRAFNHSNTGLTGSIPSLSTNTALVNFVVGENNLTGNIPDLSNNTSLIKFEVKNNDLTGYVGGTVSNTLLDFKANNNNLSQAAVDSILAAFNAAGASNGTLFLGGGTNAAPTGGSTNSDYLALIGRGWNVELNIGMNYNINVDFDLTNVPVTSFDPDGNVNDRPRINTFREDGQFVKYLSAGGVYEDDNTGGLSVPPWGDKSTASTNTNISAISGTAGITPGTLSAGVDVFTASNMEISLIPDISNWTVTNTNPGETKYQILFNTGGTKNIDVTIFPVDDEVWNFSNPGTNTIAWILSSETPLSNTFNWADGSSRETFDNNEVAQHTFTGTGSFSGVRYSNADRIQKFASRLGGGEFPTNTYAASGTIDLSKLPNLIEYTIEDHQAFFTNVNSVNTGLIRFQHWNNKNTGVSFNDLDLSRLPNLQVFSIRGISNSIRGNFTGQLHSTIPSTLITYNGKWNSLTGNLPTFTSNFSNIKDYDFTQNSIGGNLKNLANLGSNRSIKDVQFLGNRNSLNGVAGDFTINSNFTKIQLLGNQFTTADLNTIVQKCDASGVTNCTLDLRAQPFPNTVTDTASVTSLQGKGWTVLF